MESRRLLRQLPKEARGKNYNHSHILNSICIIAADISPIDVLSHLPILCEEKNVEYIYVKSRAEIGEACKTKRPTSCVFIQAPPKKSDNEKKFKKCAELIRQRNPYLA